MRHEKIQNLYLFGSLFLFLYFSYDLYDSTNKVRAIRAETEKINQLWCVEKVCHGDNVPKYDSRTETLFKIKGKFYIAPRDDCWVNNWISTVRKFCSFYWWDHAVLPKDAKYPAEVKYILNAGDYHKITIEIRVEGLNAIKGNSYDTTYETFSKIKEQGGILGQGRYTKEGFHSFQTMLFKYDNKKIANWVVSEKVRTPNGDPLALRCYDEKEYSQCDGKFLWKEDIMVSVSFRAKHIFDLSGIYQEVEKILLQLRKVS